MEYTTMTHFRGQIRGPHWGPAMDNMLIDFWRKHDCLFNSSVDSYYDRDLKTKLWTEFAMTIGKRVSDVERRSRSLRTQYGRLLWHPERTSTVQQRMLREKLDFLRPYIVRRRGDSYLEEKFDDRDEEEPETEGSFEQEMGSSFGSPLDADETRQDLNDECQTVTSTPNPAPLYSPQPEVAEVISLSCPQHHNNESSADQPNHRAAQNTSKHDMLNQFTEVMLSDMRQIKDPMVLMRLRRDITDLVFKAVEEDMQRHRTALEERVRSCFRPQQPRSETEPSWRHRFLKRKNKGTEFRRRTQRWEEVRHMRRATRCQLHESVQQEQTLGGVTENISQVILNASEIKKETEPHIVKIEEEMLPLP